MEGAVVEGRLEVAERVAGKHALGGCLSDTLLNAGEEVLGHGAADNMLGKFDAATMVWLDLDPDVAEHAVAAGLLLVAAVALGLASDGLLVGNARCLGHDCRAELPLQALAQHGHVRVAHRKEDLLAGLRAFDSGRWLLFEHSLQS